MKKYFALVIVAVLSLTLAVFCACKTEETPAASYKVNYLAAEGGSISGKAEQTVEEGKDGEKVNAVPDTGYEFVGWSDGLTARGRYEENVTADVTVTAKFEKLAFTVKYKAEENGYINGEDTQTVAYGGATSLVTAVPEDGYMFLMWSDGSRRPGRADENITGDKTITATFKKILYNVFYDVEGGGHIEGEVRQFIGKGENTSVVTAVPEYGYRFVKWSDGNTEPERYDCDIRANKTVTAVFAKVYFTATYQTDGGGRIFGEEVQTKLYGYSTSSVTAVASEGYDFVRWSDGLKEVTRTDICDKDKTFTAIFNLRSYKLKYETDGNGTIEGVAEQTVKHGYSASKVTAKPAKGYIFKQWSDGNTEAERIDADIKGGLSVTAQFELLYTNGAGTSTNPFSVETYRQFVNMSVHPAVCYRLENDLDLSGIEHEPVFGEQVRFTGTFDGNGKTISNMNVNTKSNFASLFGFIDKQATVKSLNVADANIVAKGYPSAEAQRIYYAGILAGVSFGNLSDIRVSGRITETGQNCCAGGLVGFAYCNTVSGCNAEITVAVNDNIETDGAIIESRKFAEEKYVRSTVGGLIGVCASVKISGCSSSGNLDFTLSQNGIPAGGMIGYYCCIERTSCFIKDCISEVAVIQGKAETGGFIEQLYFDDVATFSVSNCAARGDIQSAKCAGFIYDVDYSYESRAEITGCEASGNIETSVSDSGEYTGIAAGFCYEVYGVELFRCCYSGTIKGAYVSGFCRNIGNCVVEECFNDCEVYASIRGDSFIYDATHTDIKNCYSVCNEISVRENASVPVYGIHYSLKMNLFNCYFAGNITGNFIMNLTSSAKIKRVFIISSRDLTYDDLVVNNRGNLELAACFTIFKETEVPDNFTEMLNEVSVDDVWVKTEGLPQLKCTSEMK